MTTIKKARKSNKKSRKGKKGGKDGKKDKDGKDSRKNASGDETVEPVPATEDPYHPSYEIDNDQTYTNGDDVNADGDFNG